MVRTVKILNEGNEEIYWSGSTSSEWRREGGKRKEKKKERKRKKKRKKKSGETHRHHAVDVGFRRPAIPDQGGRVQECRDPCILPHAVLGLIHQLAVCVVPSGFSRFACHDDVGPPTAEETGEEITHGARNVGETDRGG